jgi:hypothetical protein
MASFTDIIPQFNPYVQQLPVEAMVQVGMEKQKRYDEGIQKIQSQIDNIAGLDVVRDVDKAYLQSKLNELGNNLKSVAAGDFSNFQLVNSVGGMANQIIKDPNIVNALSSTKAYRKGLEDMAALNKEGKGSISNDWDFKSRASKWLNSSNLDESFSGTYNPYTNYKKNALEVVKGLTKNKNITEDAFDFDSKGNMVIKDAILRTELAGISPEQIQQALLVGLSPNDWKQMEIDGRYNYASVDDQSFANSVNTSYKSKYDSFAEQRTILENAKSSTSSAAEKVALDKKIKDIDKILQGITTEYNNVSKTFSQGDVESAKARLFTSNFMNGFSNAFSFTETSQEYKTSPFVQNEQWRQTKEQDWKKFILGYNLDLENLAVRKAELGEKKEENRLKRLEVEGYGGFPGPVDPSTLPKLVLDNVVAQTQGYREAIAKSDADFIKLKGKDQAWLDQQRQAYLKSPNGVDPMVKEHFDQTEGKRRLADENQTMVLQINAEADRVYGDVYKKVPANAPNITYNNGAGTTYVYTPKDFVDFNSKISRYKTTTTTPGSPTTMTGGTTTTTFNDQLAKAELSPKDYTLYQVEKEKYYGKSSSQGNKVLSDNLSYYFKNVNTPYQNVINQKNEFVAKEVKDRLLAAQGLSYPISTASKLQKESLASLFGKVADLAESQKGAIAESPSLDVNTLRKISQSGDAEGSITIIEGTEFTKPMYQITARGKDGTTTFNMTAEQKFAVFGDRYEPSPALKAFRPYQSMMQKFSEIDPKTGQRSLYMSTNPVKGDVTFQNSSLNGADFPNIKSYGVTGAIFTQNGGNTYSLRLNFYDPITRKYIDDVSYPRMLTEEEVAPAMLGITDAWVYEILNDGKQATKTDLQILQRASKKPL